MSLLGSMRRAVVGSIITIAFSDLAQSGTVQGDVKAARIHQRTLERRMRRRRYR